MSKISTFFGWVTILGIVSIFIFPLIGVPVAIIGFFLWSAFKPKKEMEKHWMSQILTDLEDLERRNAEKGELAREEIRDFRKSDEMREQIRAQARANNLAHLAKMQKKTDKILAKLERENPEILKLLQDDTKKQKTDKMLKRLEKQNPEILKLLQNNPEK